jgi:hypothetical protein
MVACTKCGAENKEDAKFCSGCGAAFWQVERRQKPPSDDCFGLPQGGTIFGLFIGAIIILWGLSNLFSWDIDIWTFAIIAIGLLIVVGAIYSLTRKRR